MKSQKENKGKQMRANENNGMCVCVYMCVCVCVCAVLRAVYVCKLALSDRIFNISACVVGPRIIPVLLLLLNDYVRLKAQC